MVGQIKLKVLYYNDMGEDFVVDSIVGYDYHGDYFVVHVCDTSFPGPPITHDHVIPLRDIKEIVREGCETVH